MSKISNFAGWVMFVLSVLSLFVGDYAYAVSAVVMSGIFFTMADILEIKYKLK